MFCLVTVSWVKVGQTVNSAFNEEKHLHVAELTHRNLDGLLFEELVCDFLSIPPIAEKGLCFSLVF